MSAKESTITIDWGEHDLPEADRRAWLPSWVVADDGEEGDFLYDGPGGTTTTHSVPPGAIGIRFRWAPQITDPSTDNRRQWNVYRRIYSLDEHCDGTIKAVEFCS